MSSPKSSYIQTSNGTKIHISQTGNPTGPLVLLLHGLGASTETFTLLLPYLYPETNRLVSVDLEGFGKTSLSSPDVKLSIPRYVDDLGSVVAFLQRSEEEENEAAAAERKIVIIGHSLGSILAMHYAAANPETIRGLALLGAGRSIANIPAARERMLSLARQARKEGISAVANVASISNFPQEQRVATQEELGEKVRRQVAACDAEAYALACEAVAGLDHLDPEYGDISAPTLLLAGNGDVISPPERSMKVKQLIGSNAWVKVLEGVGHQMILQDLGGSVKAIRSLFHEVDM